LLRGMSPLLAHLADLVGRLDDVRSEGQSGHGMPAWCQSDYWVHAL